MPLPIVPVVANHDRVHQEDAVPDDSASDSDQSDENFAKNEQEMDPEEQEQEPAPPTPPRCNVGARSQMDSPSSLDRPLPDSSGPANDWPPASDSDAAPCPLPPHAIASSAPASPLPLNAEPSQEARAPASPPATTPPTGDDALRQPTPAPPAPTATSAALRDLLQLHRLWLHLRLENLNIYLKLFHILSGMWQWRTDTMLF
nr:vegetative cell wall protein gp1-like [Lolium perenne]